MGSKKKDDFDTALIIISNTVQELGQSIILKKKKAKTLNSKSN
jgi:hypothetical protein